VTKSAKKKIFINSDIICDSIVCDCEVDTIHPVKGVTKNIIRLYPKDYKHCYAYKNGKELVSTNADGATLGRAVLPDLLAIKDNKTIKKFIERHGYPFPFEPSEDNSLESEALFSFIHRLEATVNLMTALGEGGDDYRKILALTLYLLLTPQTSIEFTNDWEPFCSCYHEMGYIWNNLNEVDERILCQEDETYNIEEGCYVEDRVRPERTFLDASEYNEAINYGNFDRQSMKNIATYLFRNANKVDYHCRLAIDFLFHFSRDVGDILKYDYKGELIFRESNPSADIRFKDGLDEQLKQALVALAKHTLKAEFEWDLDGIRPSYNTQTMAPAWHIDYLLSGIYFSLFNIEAKNEQYRICAKPTCGRYFLTKADSTKQKYCSYNCSNATAQNVHRRKVKEQQVRGKEE